MFEKLKNKMLGSPKILREPSNPIERLREEQVYAQVLSEMEKGIRRDGIWAIALAEADFDESKAKAIYLKRRAQSIIDEEPLQKVNEVAVTVKNEIPKLGLSVLADGKTLKKYDCKKCGFHGNLYGSWNTGLITGYHTIYCPKCKDIFKVLNW